MTRSVSLDLVRATMRDLVIDDRGRWRLRRGAAGGDLVTPPWAVASPGPVTLDWLTQWTAPLVFDKHPFNPIYSPVQSGTWDDWTNGVSIIPTDGGTRYRMYYSGRKGAGIGFAEASVDEPTKWWEHPASPVLRPRDDNWEGNMINQPRVVKVSESHWRMYYTGWGWPGPGLPAAPGTPWAMGLAESFDGGTTWKRYQDAPILDRGGVDSPDGAGACVPMVLRVGGTWMMWYTAGLVEAGNPQNVHLCLATSGDGIHWDKHPGNPVLTDDFSKVAYRSVTSRCYVRHDEGVFRMWYSFAKPDYRIYYAESLDGVQWERAPVAPVLDVSPPPAWDDVMVEYPEVQVVEGVFRLWFSGNGYGSVGYATGTPGTGVRVSVRSGDAATPDATWSEWTPAERGRPIDPRRYLQVRAELWSTDLRLSPALNRVTVERANDADRI